MYILIMLSTVAFPQYVTAQFVRRAHTEVVLVKTGTRVTRLHKNAVIIRHAGIDYRYYRGVFYKPVGRRYVVVSPPAGVVIPSLPVAARLVVRGGKQYHFWNGNYFEPVLVKGKVRYRVVIV